MFAVGCDRGLQGVGALVLATIPRLARSLSATLVTPKSFCIAPEVISLSMRASLSARRGRCQL